MVSSIMEFVVWHYLRGWKWYWKRFWFNLRRLEHFFSFLVLIKTLFKPWKRLTADYEGGFDIGKFFEKISFNIISSTIGLIVRIILIGFCLLLTAGYLILSVVFFGIWWLVPVFGWEWYMKDKQRSGDLLKQLVLKIKNNPDDTGKYLIESEMGKFVINKVEKDISQILKLIKLNKEDVLALEAVNFEGLVNLFLVKNSEVKTELQKLNMSEEELVLAARWWDKRQKDKLADYESGLGKPGIGWNLLFGYTPTLDKYSEDLSLGEFFAGNLIGREGIIRRMDTVINSGKSILLVGEPGVGKMTVVYEFAERAINGGLSRDLAYKKLLILDYRAAVAGAGDKDTKKTLLKKILKEAEAAGNIVLVIKDLFRMTNAEVEGDDYTDVFSEVLEKGKVAIIAVSERLEYEKFLANDLRISKNFETVEVIPPTKDEAMLILIEAAERLENKNKVKVTVGALKQILDGSEKYITEAPFPEKAVELLGIVVSEWSGTNKTIGLEEVNKILSEKTGVSIKILTEKEKDKLKNLEEIMSKKLVGQKAAIDLIAKSLRSRLTGSKSEDRPIGSFLFLGPTGVGKTQTAKVLANIYFGSEKNILRFDMAEYSGVEALGKLIGIPSQNRPGLMTVAIRNRPASLLLLDEIEKADSGVYNLFLTLLDEGYINDELGKKIIGKHLFVVATSNAAAGYIREEVKNGVRGEELQKSVLNFIQEKGLFSPEFLNRFDGVVVFEPLEEESLYLVAELMLEELKDNLLKKNIEISFDNEVVKKIVKDGYNIELGARPMRRVIELDLGDIIGQAVIDNKIKPGDRVAVTVDLGSNKFAIKG